MAYSSTGVVHDDAVMHKAPISLPNSQDSSFAETVASQRSQLQASSAGFLGPSQPSSGREATTPSTSWSNRSSQENAIDDQRGIEGLGAVQIEGDMTHASYTRLSNAVTAKPTSAPKRMANGEVKSPPGSLPTSPLESNLYGSHSRTTSMTSRGSQIGEISEKLRARMSYAMVKVQHGWEGHKLSDLEHMTSNNASPVSATSYNRFRGYDTPPANESPTDPTLPHQNLHHPAMLTPHEQKCSSPRSQQATARSHVNPYPSLSPSASLLPRGLQNPTYESFWREHSNTAFPNSPNRSGPSLAPPVELARRSSTDAASSKHPPPLHTNNLSHQNTSKLFPGKLEPQTPPHRAPLSKQRTPSQQAAVEKDAVETLLFMSSPGNSQHYPAASQTSQASPSRAQAIPMNGLLSGIHTATFPPAIPTQQTARAAPRQLNDAEINKILDEMPESSSSDEDEPLGERRAAPRVRGP